MSKQHETSKESVIVNKYIKIKRIVKYNKNGCNVSMELASSAVQRERYNLYRECCPATREKRLSCTMTKKGRSDARGPCIKPVSETRKPMRKLRELERLSQSDKLNEVIQTVSSATSI